MEILAAVLSSCSPYDYKLSVLSLPLGLIAIDTNFPPITREMSQSEA